VFEVSLPWRANKIKGLEERRHHLSLFLVSQFNHA